MPQTWLYFYARTERDNKNENLHLPRKPEGKRKAVVVERPGFYHDLHWDNSVSDRACKPVERYPLCSYRLLCVSLPSGGRNRNNGLSF